MNIQSAKVDSTLGLTIPENFAKEIGVNPNSEVLIRRIGNTIVISAPHKKSTLDELLSQVTEENRHGETDTGPAMGREVA